MGHDGFLPKPEGRYLRLCRTVVWLGTLFRSADSRHSWRDQLDDPARANLAFIEVEVNTRCVHCHER
jgi:hypothetical protein